MTIKKMRFSFDISMPQLMSMLATANSGMKIDIFGDEDHPPKIRAINGHAPKLLQGPQGKRGGKNARGKDANGNRATAYNTILAYLVTNKDSDSIRAGQISPRLIEIGLSANSVSPQLVKLRTDGMVKRLADGTYKATAKGIAHHEKLTTKGAEAHG